MYLLDEGVFLLVTNILRALTYIKHSLSISSVALTEINKLRAEGLDICAGVASRTDEPEWAKFCMDELVVEDGSMLSECFGDRVHLQRLHRSTGVAFENMIFFDNEYSNISSVRSLGVRSFHTPNGMEEEHWREAKRALNI